MTSVPDTTKRRNAFGATSPPFIDYLKDILRRYPDGGQILKELIQNADDAGASKVVFIHDERTYEKESLWSEDLGKYQGPALYAYNDAVFTEEDWQGIQATGRSVKRNDPNRVGRFGIGFNSIYHITDVPYIFSSKYLGLLDPQEKIFGEGKGGFRWSLDDDEDRSRLITLRDQFQPLRDVVKQVSGNTWEKTIEDQFFDGTLFRFPLRCESSEISDNLYDSDKILQLFDSFIADADISLLFLRHVSNVALMHIDTSGSAAVRLKVCLQRSPGHLDPGDPDVPSKGSTVFKNVFSASPCDGKRNTQWLVTSYCFEEGKSEKIDSLAEKLCYKPQVDLAFLCDPENFISDGRLSCFLPLPNNEPNRTGLPVHINAHFGLTDNRRHIKWQDEDQKHDESAQWNELLMTDVLPHTYLKMIRDSIKYCRNGILPATTVYHLWPDILQMEHKEKWHGVAMDVVKRVLNDKAVFSLAKDEKIWVTLLDAVFPANDIKEPVLSAVAKVLIAANENLINVSKHVLDDLKRVFPEPDTLQWITPHFLRVVLHRGGLEEISHNEKLSLLEYALSDENYQELEGLQLLPLDNGTFRQFTDNDECATLIDNKDFPRELLPFCKGTFISQELSHKSLCHMENLATKETFNIINLDVQNVADLIKKHLPHDWKNGYDPVVWNLGNPEHPPREWLIGFWKYLSSYWKELSYFVDLPLLPVEPLESHSEYVFLAKLQEKPTLLFQRSKHSSLSGHIQSVIKRVGGTVIKHNECLKHYDIDTFVLPPSPKSLLKVFLNLSRNQVITGIHSASCIEKEEIKSFLSSLDSLSDEEQCLVSEISLFQLMTGEYVSAKSKYAVVRNSTPTIPSDLPIPNSVVQCVTEADRRLLSMLKIELLDVAQLALLLVCCIEKGFFSQENEKKTMTWILQHGSVLFSQNKVLHNICKKMTFVETEGQCQKVKASDVFDPRNETFKKLFEPHFFPAVDYVMTQEMLHSLHQIGLQSQEKDISPNLVLNVVRNLAELHTYSQEEACEKADVLLRVLNDNDIILKFSASQLEQLQNIQWFPCPYTVTKDLKMRVDKKCFYKPCEIRHSKYSNVVGYVMPLVDELNEKVCKGLGLLNPPPAEKVMENLSVLNAVSQNTPDIQFKMHDTYKFMQDHIDLFRELMKMNSVPWIWIENHFVLPCDVVLAYPHDLDLSPYVEKVPEEYKQFQNVFKEFGVKSTLSEEDIEKMLHVFKEKIMKRNPPIGEASELRVSIHILNWMRKEKKPVKDDTPVPVMAENQSFTMQPVANLVFCDITEEGLTDLKEDHEDFHVIHKEVCRATAEWLKIPFLSTRILNPEFIGIEQCGQTEPITQRIKNILKEYDEDSDIFKELLQNAEDAGAKVCRFMVDFRKHTDAPESLIDSGMSLCSGPCLWIFNDELFSDEDWINITKVGSASKEKKVGKIGKFGLGFNAVYHVTDIPSILSGKNLVIFDPNVTHIKKHIRSRGNPGIKLNLFQNRLFRRFPGLLRPYEGIFDCHVSEKSTENFYHGTLIKLPFRTQEESRMSEICTKVYDTDCIMHFQQHLTDKAQTHMLFLRNVEHLSLQTLLENATTPPTKHQTKSLIQITRKIMDTVELTDDIPLKDMQKYSLTCLMKFDAKCASVIDSSTATITEIIQHKTDRLDVQYWLIYSCFGTHDSLRIVQGKNELFSVPIGGIAVPLQKEPCTEKWAAKNCSLVGQAFSFLPLSIRTGLPVNINGSFAVMSNRKCLWETGIKGRWNRALLKDAVANAYITVLLILKELSENGSLSGYAYYTFWPDTEKVSKAFEPLVEAFYSAIVNGFCTEDLELFSDGKNWYSVKGVRFLDPYIAKHKDVGKLAEKIFLTHHKPGYCGVTLPSFVRQSMIKSGFKDIVMARTISWKEFYQEVVFNNLDALESHERNVLIVSAIDLNDDEVDDLLKRHRCIPSQRTGNLQYIRRVVYPSGKVACLYDQEEGRFLDGTRNDFCSLKRIQRLIALGMLNDHLSVQDLTERAGTISTVWKRDKLKAVERIQCLFAMMQDLLVDRKSDFWCKLQNIPFIPACPPLTMEQQSHVLKKPCELYNFNCRYLVNMTEFTVDDKTLKIHSDNSVLEKLGVCQKPPLDAVLMQLKKASYRCDVYDQSLLSRIACESYEYLNNWLLCCFDPTPIEEFANSFPFVFVEDKFVHVKSVAKWQEFEVMPYLFVLPSGYLKFHTLWECVGVQDQFTRKQFADVLLHMTDRYGTKPLSHSDLNICLDILSKGLLKTKNAVPQNFPVPDENSVLTLSSSLCYNDSPWMPVSADITLCHKLISREVAQHFGVRTTRHHTLQNHLVDGFAPYAKEFGQHEKLTVRLKNIINAYPSKKDIIKELIQNADDAEATEIHFIWDRRNHGTVKTFGKKWNPLQGPALCVYNNKVFTDTDLHGIQQLGEGGKHGQRGKTGKYGLGFNSVYHLSDCPAILTGDKWLCIFDPHARYSELATRHMSGCKYSLDEEFKNSFMDVYQTFLPSVFSLESGTMFRLPLRTEEMAAKSEICKDHIREYDICNFLQVLVEDPDGLALFLTHIKKILFHIISPDSDPLHTVCVVEKQLSEESSMKRAQFQDRVQHSLMSGQTIPCQVIYDMQISSSFLKAEVQRNSSQWVIAEQFGLLESTSSKNNRRSDITQTPQAAVAACTGIGPLEGRAFYCLPLPGVTGLPVHVNGNFEVGSSRRDLWKEDGISPKTTWNESLKLDVISPLYADLLKHIQTTLETVNHPTVSSLGSWLESSYLKFFPYISKDVGQEWHKMIHSVYRSIRERDLLVIPVLQTFQLVIGNQTRQKYTVRWSNVYKHNPIDSPHFSQELSPILLRILEDIGMSVVPWSCKMDKIYTGFKIADVEVMSLCSKTVREYLKQKPLNDATQRSHALPLPLDHTLIKDKKRCSILLNFCTRDIDEKNISALNRLPLLLTQDQMLNVFDSHSPRLISKFWDMFQGQEQLFVDYSVNSKHTELLQNGHYVVKLTQSIAFQHLKSLLEDLEQYPDGKPPTLLKRVWEYVEEEISSENRKDGGTTFKQFKKVFLDYAVLPITFPDQHNRYGLQTIRKFSSVVWDPKEEISSILVQLGMGALDHSFFDGLPYVHRYLRSEVLQTSEITAVLDQLVMVPHSNFKIIDSDELDRLVYFLTSGISAIRNTHEYQNKLKKLPLFETVHGERQSIQWCNKVYVLRTRFESIPNLYCVVAKGHVVLKDSHVNQKLSANLGIRALNDIDFYVKLLLPLLHTLTERQVLDSIQLLLILKQYQTYMTFHDHIISHLRSVSFVRDIHGTPQLASYFFDEKEPLYKIMLPQEKFVPTKFWEEFGHKEASVRWLLKELGMKHIVSDVEIIAFARAIQSEACESALIDELKRKSSALFTEALKYNATKKNSNLLNRIKDIKFIFPLQIQKQLCDYHPPFAGSRDTVSIKGSLIDTNSDNQCLIWSSMPILPTDKLPQSWLKDLVEAGAFHHPPCHLVAQNLKNIWKSECPNNHFINIRKRAFCYSYAYLQSKDFSGSQLQDLPVVLVENDTVLVQASRVVLSLNHHLEFRPYLYKVSPQHALYVEFFKRIGVEEKPTIRQYSIVLKDIYMDSERKETLNANQQKTVKRAVQHLFRLMKLEQMQFTEYLYLPSTDGKLYKSKDLYFNDTVFQTKRLEDSLKDRVRLLMNLGHCHLGEDLYEHQKMLLLLPKHSQPTMLSQITSECLVASSLKCCEHGKSCEFSSWFERHLSSNLFLHGLTCLIREESKGAVSEADAVELCQNTFGRLQIICCETLETELHLNHEPLPNTTSETQVHVTKETHGCTFYLRHSDDMAFKVMHEVAMSLTKEISSLLPFPVLLPALGELLLCDTQEEVEKTLEKYGIHNSTIKGGLHHPDPGSSIPEEWYDALDMNFMNNYEKGEYVGFKKPSEDEHYYHAVIVERLVTSHETGQYCRYKVNIGKDEFVEVSSLDLYQFKRKKTSSSKQNACGTIQLLDRHVSPEEGCPQSFEEIMKEIDKCLKEIRTLSKDEQQKAIRRLYLWWHPDKNPGQEELANKAFKYLNNKLAELQDKAIVSESPRNFSRQNETAQSHWSWNFENFYSQWNSEASRHCRSRERFRHSNSGLQNHFYYFQQEMSKADREEAKRWSLQARYDLNSTKNDMGRGSTEWCLFKIHQAVEKALIAVEYRKCGKQSPSCSISRLAQKVSRYSPELATLPVLVSQLKCLGVDGKTTQYPNYHSSPKIPHNAFQPEVEKEAFDIAWELLQKVNPYITQS